MLNLKDLATKARLPQKEEGQGLVEYALILVLVAIVVIAILLLLGPVVGNVFSNVSCNLEGESCGIASAPGGSGSGGAQPTATPNSDPYANAWGPERYQNPGLAVQDFCYGKPSGTNYKLYVHPDGNWHKAAGTATSSSDGPAQTSGGSYTQVGTGTCS